MKRYYSITILAIIVITLLQGYNISLQYKDYLHYKIEKIMTHSIYCLTMAQYCPLLGQLFAISGHKVMRREKIFGRSTILLFSIFPQLAEFFISSVGWISLFLLARLILINRLWLPESRRRSPSHLLEELGEMSLG